MSHRLLYTTATRGRRRTTTTIIIIIYHHIYYILLRSEILSAQSETVCIIVFNNSHLIIRIFLLCTKSKSLVCVELNFYSLNLAEKCELLNTKTRTASDCTVMHSVFSAGGSTKQACNIVVYYR